MGVSKASLLLSNGWTITLQTFDTEPGHPPAVAEGYTRVATGFGWVLDQETVKIVVGSVVQNGHAEGKSEDVPPELVLGHFPEVDLAEAG